MTWNSIMGLLSSIAISLPILFILLFRLGEYRSFVALLIYYIILLVNNLLTDGYLRASADTIEIFNICKNLLEAPLVLFFLTYFNPSSLFTKKIKIAILTVVAFELCALLIVGFNSNAVTLFWGAALITVFVFCLQLFVRQAKIAIMHNKGSGKVVITASLLIAFGCNLIIYLVYYVFKNQNVEDTFLVYFLVATFSSLLMCAGIIIERKRVQKLKELKITRKELAAFYPDVNTTAVPQRRTAMLDFDRDQWN